MEPGRVATYGDEDEDEMYDEPGSFLADAKSSESRHRLTAATRTERYPTSKGSLRKDAGVPDNTSNVNTAKNTDGTASDAHLGVSGRGAGLTAFGSTKKSTSKRISKSMSQKQEPSHVIRKITKA